MAAQNVNFATTGGTGIVASLKQYLAIETFLQGCKQRVYERFHTRGRMLPEGLVFRNSWLEKDGDRCFQLMETDHPCLFTVWTDRWKDLVNFEVIEIGEKPSEADDA